MNVYESIVKGLQIAISYDSSNCSARTAKCTDTPASDYDAKQINEASDGQTENHARRHNQKRADHLICSFRFALAILEINPAICTK